MAKIETIEGIGPDGASKLSAAGISTVEDLLEKGATKQGRGQIAEASGIGEARILKWVNCADLMRVKGVGEEYSELLEAAGVDSVPELKQRNPQNLHAAMNEANEAKQLVRLMPSEKVVEKWVEHAKTLDRIVTH